VVGMLREREEGFAGPGLVAGEHTGAGEIRMRQRNSQDPGRPMGANRPIESWSAGDGLSRLCEFLFLSGAESGGCNTRISRRSNLSVRHGLEVGLGCIQVG
jgi:hypothetical protein